jgi:hypothetical protein
MKSPQTKILVIRMGGLGDLLVGLPAIQLVRRLYPDAFITLVGRPEYGALFERTGIVDETVSGDSGPVADIFREEGCGPSEWHRQYRIVLALAGKRGLWPGDERLRAWGFENPFFVWAEDRPAGTMLSRFFFDGARHSLGGILARVDPDPEGLFGECGRLPVDAGLRDAALSAFDLSLLPPGGTRLVVHPGSGGRAKCWPLGNFLKVVRWAADKGIGGVLVTGEAEKDLEPELRKHALPPGWSRIERPTILSLAGLLAGSTHYVGNDSGPTHLAAACGLSVLALFKIDNEAAWRPFGRTRILSAADPTTIPGSEVLRSLGKGLKPD